mmetsp:Transcript_7988/g.22477  ORF Transcript_7988/g.22477 Transcript_7988/m.22477 type:complete len:205 (+) Transcript_7988:112-726(+)
MIMQISLRLELIDPNRRTDEIVRFMRFWVLSVASFVAASISLWRPSSAWMRPLEFLRLFKVPSSVVSGSSKLRMTACCCWIFARCDTGCSSAPPGARTTPSSPMRWKEVPGDDWKELPVDGGTRSGLAEGVPLTRRCNSVNSSSAWFSASRYSVTDFRVTSFSFCCPLRPSRSRLSLSYWCFSCETRPRMLVPSFARSQRCTLL